MVKKYVFSTEDCNIWYKNKSINPITKKQINSTSRKGILFQLEKQCNSTEKRRVTAQKKVQEKKEPVQKKVSAQKSNDAFNISVEIINIKKEKLDTYFKTDDSSATLHIHYANKHGTISINKQKSFYKTENKRELLDMLVFILSNSKHNQFVFNNTTNTLETQIKSYIEKSLKTNKIKAILKFILQNKYNVNILQSNLNLNLGELNLKEINVNKTINNIRLSVNTDNRAILWTKENENKQKLFTAPAGEAHTVVYLFFKIIKNITNKQLQFSFKSEKLDSNIENRIKGAFLSLTK